MCITCILHQYCIVQRRDDDMLHGEVSYPHEHKIQEKLLAQSLIHTLGSGIVPLPPRSSTQQLLSDEQTPQTNNEHLHKTTQVKDGEPSPYTSPLLSSCSFRCH